MNLFRYPKARHSRSQSPSPYRTLRSFKPFLQIEFLDRCVYCLFPDLVRGENSFGVDHYLPKKHYPSLEWDYRNLYYACNACNSRKSDYYPLTPIEKSDRFIPNPCDHVMFDHLRYLKDAVSARSKPGEFTLDLLDLNEENVVHARGILLVAVQQLEVALRKHRATLSDLHSKGPLASPDRESKRQIALRKLEAEILDTEKKLSCLHA